MPTTSTRYTYGIFAGFVFGVGLGAVLTSSAAPVRQVKPEPPSPLTGGIVKQNNGSSLLGNPKDGKIAVLTREGNSYIYDLQKATFAFLDSDGSYGTMQFTPLQSYSFRINIDVTRAGDKEAKLVFTSNPKGTIVEMTDASKKKRFLLP